MAPTRKEKRKVARKAQAKITRLVFLEFDFTANITLHGSINDAQIEAAFYDPRGITFPPTTRSRTGQRRPNDGRMVLLAQDGASGPLLQIVFVREEGRIKPIHARPMTPAEKRLYQS
jgi:uncharacterized DUF497 family protein